MKLATAAVRKFKKKRFALLSLLVDKFALLQPFTRVVFKLSSFKILAIWEIDWYFYRS